MDAKFFQSGLAVLAAVILPVLGVTSCGGSSDDEGGSVVMPARDDLILTAPQQFLPYEKDGKPWRFMLDSAADGLLYKATYKHVPEEGEPDFVSVRIELIADAVDGNVHYQRIRARYRKKSRETLSTLKGVGDRSCYLAIEPKRILIRRANVVVEIEAEKDPNAARQFAAMVDDRIVAALKDHGVIPMRTSESETEAPVPDPAAVRGSENRE